MSDPILDLLVVGGGINGAGIARDAAGRGLSVMLVEKDDLAAHTSSASSKLVHGGLRYLEQFEFRLVRESLAERERLLRAAPHIVEPLQFVLPLTKGSRPSWMIRAGLFLYDRLAGRDILPASRSVTLDLDSEFSDGLLPHLSKAFSYWDCRVEDSRLVVLNALDAAERGAKILTRTELLDARRGGDCWTATIDGPDGKRTVRARAVVNAAGPWVAQIFDRLGSVASRRRIRLVKGSHIVLPRLYEGEHAFILQNSDRRVVFAIPFGGFTLVGTTDVVWSGHPDEPVISDEEVNYLLDTVSRVFTARPSAGDVIWSFSGVRALVDDGSRTASRVTRDYALELDAAGPPLLSVFGGKLTTYRSVAERALDQLRPHLLEAGPAWNDGAPLPGGDVPGLDVERYASELAHQHPSVPAELLTRFAHNYGTRTERLLEGVQGLADLGEHFGTGLHKREVDYLVDEEWARTAEDILYRRTKLGLHIDQGSVARLSAYIATRSNSRRRA